MKTTRNNGKHIRETTPRSSSKSCLVGDGTDRGVFCGEIDSSESTGFLTSSISKATNCLTKVCAAQSGQLVQRQYDWEEEDWESWEEEQSVWFPEEESLSDWGASGVDIDLEEVESEAMEEEPKWTPEEQQAPSEEAQTSYEPYDWEVDQEFTPYVESEDVQEEDISVTVDGITWYREREYAVDAVPVHVVPRECFVWYGGGPVGYPWRVIPGTGCAHWVAHQRNILATPGCYEGYAIRVAQVTAGLTSHSLQDAQVGDIWTNDGGTHTGIVRSVNTEQGTGNVTSVEVEHCSSAQGGVVTTTFSAGRFYR